MLLNIIFLGLAIVQVHLYNRLGAVWYVRGLRITSWPIHAAFGIGALITTLYFTGDIDAATWLILWRLFSISFVPFLYVVFGKPDYQTVLNELADMVDRLERQVSDNFQKLVLWRR